MSSREQLHDVISAVSNRSLPQYLDLRDACTQVLIARSADTSRHATLFDYAVRKGSEEDLAATLTTAMSSDRKVAIAALASLELSRRRWHYTGREVQFDDQLLGRRGGLLYRFSNHMIDGLETTCIPDAQPIHRNELSIISYSGLNGCGKSTVIKANTQLAARMGVEVNLVKFPRTDSHEGQEARKLLTAGRADPDQIQHLCLADYDAWLKKTKRGLWMADRLPPIEALVYGNGPEVKRQALDRLSAILPHLTPIIVDRVASACIDSVSTRAVAQRVFERDIDLMVHQQISLWGLARSLPNSIFVNTDVPVDIDKAKKAIKMACFRTGTALATYGILRKRSKRNGLGAHKAIFEWWANDLNG